MKRARDIFRFLLDQADPDARSALVTITGVIGSSSRSPGTHMAVRDTGAYVGSLSGGCVEAAVVGEALRVIESGRAELVRFGAGSRFIDIRLPCGGGIELLVTPSPPRSDVERALATLEQRRPLLLALGREGGLRAEAFGDRSAMGWHGDRFLVRHAPELRLIILGHGAETEALAALALGYGADVVVLSPDAAIVAKAAARGARSALLRTPARSPDLVCDPNTAVVTLFHEHDWEAALLEQALEQDAFFVGSMGSRTTHALRLEALAARGVPAEALARLAGPIGLIPASRDPDTLALSVLGEVVARYQQHETSEAAYS